MTTRQQWTDAKARQTQDTNNTNYPQKKHCPGTVSKIFYWRAQQVSQRANLIPSSDMDQGTQMPGLHKPPNFPQNILIKTQKGDKSKIWIQQYTKQSTGAKEIQQANTAGPTTAKAHRPPLFHQQISLQVGNVIESEVRPTSVQLKRKGESKVAKRDCADHQALSMLQYIKVIANLFIMGNYFKKLRWIIMRTNNLLQLKPSHHRIQVPKVLGARDI